MPHFRFRRCRRRSLPAGPAGSATPRHRLCNRRRRGDVTGTRPAPADDTRPTWAVLLPAAPDDRPDSIDAFADSLDALDVLVNNAGANFPGGPRRMGTRHLRHCPRTQSRRSHAPHDRVPSTVGCELPGGWGQHRQYGVDGSVPRHSHRPRIRIGESWSGHAHRQPRKAVGWPGHPGQCRGAGGHRNPHDRADERLSGVARRRAGSHPDGPTRDARTRSSARCSSWPARRRPTSRVTPSSSTADTYSPEPWP